MGYIFSCYRFENLIQLTFKFFLYLNFLFKSNNQGKAAIQKFEAKDLHICKEKGHNYDIDIIVIKFQLGRRVTILYIGLNTGEGGIPSIDLCAQEVVTVMEMPGWANAQPRIETWPSNFPLYCIQFSIGLSGVRALFAELEKWSGY